jgi:hypothetical protein
MKDRECLTACVIRGQAHIANIDPMPSQHRSQETDDSGALLLPADTFRSAFGKHRHQLGIGELIEMKRTFGASIMAIMKRAEQLGLVSPATFKRFCIYANQHQWRSLGEPGDNQCVHKESSGRFRRLVLRAVAKDMISASAGAEHLGVGLQDLREELKTVIA